MDDEHDIAAPHRRVEARQKVTGTACYTTDVQLPGALTAAFVRSPHPHARVRHVDLGRAMRVSGVRAALTGEVLNLQGDPIRWYAEQTPLFDTTVRFQGDEVAALAADSAQALEEALELVDVDYEALPPVPDLDCALKSDAPVLHGTSNLAGEPICYERGDTGRGFDAAAHTIDHVWSTDAVLHQALEPHGAVAAWAGDQLTLYESTQGIWSVRNQLAETLGLPRNKVRVITEHMGGGFGAKQVAWKPSVMAALLARRAQRPVRLQLDRTAESIAAGHRNATRQHVRLAADSQGRLLAIELEAKVLGGAYTLPGESSDVAGLFQHLYRCANVRTRQQRIYVNTGPAVAFRAPGYVEACFALESAMDELAQALQIDPLELRRRNHCRDDQVKGRPWSSPDALERCYERADASFGWRRRRDGCVTVSTDNQGSKRRGFGFAAHEWLGGSSSPPAWAWLRIDTDASVEVIVGTQDIGTGTRTMVAQTVAGELGIPIGQVVVRLGDTGVAAPTPASAGSHTTPTVLPAVRAAARDARSNLLAAAADRLECTPVDLVVDQGRIIAASGTQEPMPIAELLESLEPHEIHGRGAWTPADDANDEAPVTVRTFGAQCAEVEVDIDTGEVTVLRITSAPDCGRIVNPLLADSQVIGGVTQGIGQALMESRTLDHRSGCVINPNLEAYLVPTCADIPRIEHAAVNLADTAVNPAGVKGLGELPMIPTAPAIVNAIFDATGVRLRSLPVTRRKLLDALHEQASRTPTDKGFEK